MLFFLAAVLGLAGVALWLFDVQRNRPPRQTLPEQEPIVKAELGPEEVESPEEFSAGPPAAEPKPKRSSFQGFPAGLRREKRQWAQSQGFDFEKSDDLLAQEWERGPEGTAKNIVSGSARGTEIRLFEINGITMMAARRNAASEVLFLAQREADPDLIRVGQADDLVLMGSDQGAVQRMLDERAYRCFSLLPDAVESVWCEADWVLTQLSKPNHQQDWNQTAQAITWLADAAMVLPRRGNTDLPVPLEQMDPTRPLPPTPPAQELEQDATAANVPEPEIEATVVELPSRAAKISMGEVEQRPLGGDEIDPIGTGEKPQPSDFQGTRVLRDLSAGSSIFDDVARDLGTDPLEKDE
ncbi:type III secretion system chaperone family protein [Corynebacterium gerontici]|uniref:Uncharacterized protein n=1 Tax=Corynebacterium gerontici TaxID=2079234 RepID=A0A3G6J2I1_9CORY|nr:hypothetical protein [Corynebacterium gerontici]AZA10600.1 hypothetical protein CGERO_01330 [Corynebacterium gerontici]